MIWNRLAVNELYRLAGLFPAVAILGARQVGKTTLARAALPDAAYCDLEAPLVRERFQLDPAFELTRRPQAALILDEAQVVPDVFPALRGVIDSQREAKGQFYVLGSAQPDLVRGVSESLAGRVGILELDPLVSTETGLAVETHWLQGGFPEALRSDFRAWWEAYLRTIIQRDLTSYGLRPDPVLLRRLFGMLAHQQGGLRNSSALGAALGVSYHTVQHWLDVLEGVFLVRRLPPFSQNVGKRLAKSPKLYLRDTGLLHHLLNISTLGELDTHPIRGASWETFVLEEIIRREKPAKPYTQFYFWRTSTGMEIDLILDRGAERIAVEIKAHSAQNPHDARRLEAMMKDIGAARGYLVGIGDHAFELTPRVQSLGFSHSLRSGPVIP